MNEQVADKTQLYQHAIMMFSGKIALQLADAMEHNVQVRVNQEQVNNSINQISTLFDVPFPQVQKDLFTALHTHDIQELRYVMELKKRNLLH